jgi:hypothetical protein
MSADSNEEEAAVPNEAEAGEPKEAAAVQANEVPARQQIGDFLPARPRQQLGDLARAADNLEQSARQRQQIGDLVQVADDLELGQLVQVAKKLEQAGETNKSAAADKGNENQDQVHPKPQILELLQVADDLAQHQHDPSGIGSLFRASSLVGDSNKEDAEENEKEDDEFPSLEDGDGDELK